MRKIKVLGFDGWTMGVRHYVRLLDAFAESNIDLVLAHLGSWGEDKGREKEESINGLTVRDISFYDHSSYEEILDFEQPDLVLFLSTETFAHRAFQRYCKCRGIPTLHLYHGLVSVTVLDGKREPFKLNLISQIRFISRQAYKSLFKTFPVYAESLWKTSANVFEWMRFLRDIIYRILGKTIFIPADDSVSSKCCVYTAADIRDATSRFRLDSDNVVVVGNPDLLTFGVTSNAIGAMSSRDSAEFSDVMYIDTGLSSFGSNFKSTKEYAEYIISLNSKLSLQKRNLIFKSKPHPVEYAEYIKSVLQEHNIEVVENDEFINRMKTCCACITEPSTLGLLPTLMGMPLFLARFGPMGSLLYGSIFTTYPRAQYLDDIGRFNELLSREQGSCDPNQVMAWINDNSGPMPAADMPKRVTQVVMDLVLSKRGAACGVAGE